MLKTSWLSLLVPALLLSLLVPALLMLPFSARGQDAELQRRIYQEAVANPNDKAKVDALIATLIEAPRGSGRFLIEGDLLLSREEISSYLRSLRDPVPPQVRSEELIVNTHGGRLDFIADPSKRRMRYWVDMASFPTVDTAKAVQRNFQSAARDWERRCPECGIEFTEVAQAEIGGDPASFVIRFEDVSGGPIARAFFPSSPPDDRVVMIFPGYLDAALRFDPVGVLRHEIGHILGYRHEHIVNIPGCAREGSAYVPITPYTPKSVMHYFCGGAGSFDLSIRPEDERGHRCLYLTGAPCPPAGGRSK